jgi:hypothetical protein
VVSVTACVLGVAEPVGVGDAVDVAVGASVGEGIGVIEAAGVADGVGVGEVDLCVGVVVTVGRTVDAGVAEGDGTGLAVCGLAVGDGVGVGDATALTTGVTIWAVATGCTGAMAEAGVAAVTGETRPRPASTPAISSETNARQRCDGAKRCNAVAENRSRASIKAIPIRCSR